MIFITGDSFKNHIVAIVYPEEETVRRYCVENGIATNSFAEMIKTKEVREMIQGDM
jgi:long-subunit acyl-CoA synthetase (AMP-forming)